MDTFPGIYCFYFKLESLNPLSSHADSSELDSLSGVLFGQIGFSFPGRSMGV